MVGHVEVPLDAAPPRSKDVANGLMEFSAGLGASPLKESAPNPLPGLAVGAVMSWSKRASESSSLPWLINGSFLSNMTAPTLNVDPGQPSQAGLVGSTIDISSNHCRIAHPTNLQSQPRCSD